MQLLTHLTVVGDVSREQFEGKEILLFIENARQGTKIFQYCTCPAGPVTYNFHSSCKHTHLSFKSLCSKEHKGVI